jgi:chemotaxis protein MotB
VRDRRRGGGDDANRWLTTYGDVVTLLLAFFVLLFAMSEIDEERFEQLVAGFQQPFNNPGRVSILPENSGLLDEQPPAVTVPDPVTTTTPFREETTGTTVAETDVESEIPPLIVDRRDLLEVQEKLESALLDAGFEDAANFRITERGLVVSIATDDLLFPTGSAELGPKGREIIAAVAPALAEIANVVQVEGHTDNVPYNARGYDNWNLSADRALAVVHLLIDHGIHPDRLGATGYASYRPLESNDTPEGRAANRRVELVVLINGEAHE